MSKSLSLIISFIGTYKSLLIFQDFNKILSCLNIFANIVARLKCTEALVKNWQFLLRSTIGKGRVRNKLGNKRLKKNPTFLMRKDICKNTFAPKNIELHSQ